MDNKPTIIGLSGVAGSGKDLFYTLLTQVLSEDPNNVGHPVKCRKLSLAEALKEEVKEWSLEQYGIDPTNCTRADKEVIRPLLVFHGTVRRGQTSGRYWIDILDKKIKNLNLESDEILVITDIRYDQYEKDEVDWLKNELEGILVHISHFIRVGSDDTSPPAIIEKTPANDAEKINDPKLMEAADFRVRWPFVDGSEEEVSAALSSFAKHFAKNYLDNKE